VASRDERTTRVKALETQQDDYYDDDDEEENDEHVLKVDSHLAHKSKQTTFCFTIVADCETREEEARQAEDKGFCVCVDLRSFGYFEAEVSDGIANCSK
jgi:hypothetical protein